MGMFTILNVCFLVLIGHDVNAGIYNIFIPDTRLSGFVMEKISPIGMEMCVKQCSKRVSCASLNFHRIRLECELSFRDGTTNPSNLTSDAEYIYVERSQIPQEYLDTCSGSCSPRGSCVQAATGTKCFISDCPEFHPDANTTSVKVTATKIGSVLTYTCNLDPSITLTSTCKSDGTWSSSASSCASSDCFDTTESCWKQFNFDYDTSFDGCPWGTKYVRRTQYPSAPFVGVVLCSPTRYKIVLGSNLTSQFLSIGDGAGSGADHCELVGGSESNAVTANDFSSAPDVTGYFRSNWGEAFSIGPIGYQDSFNYYNSWYECGVTIAPDPPPPACFNTTTSCWYEYNFVHDTAWNGCNGGKKYVKQTQFTSAPLVGVVLCSPTRYKIFLGANLTDTFLNVGDGSGQGEDHCQLVGGLDSNAVLPGDHSNAPSLTGYARSSLGQEFNIQAIGGGSGWYSNSWYECGVQIPPEPECMTATPPCWYAYNVTLDDSFNGCSGGTTLVRRTALTSAPYLAVVLCSSTRYKLFLAANLTTTFLNIGDGNGSGEDHCELVGGSESTAVTAGDYVNSPAVSGYYRSSAGEEFSFGNIGYAETGYYFNSYLECGVSIPGTDTVV